MSTADAEYARLMARLPQVAAAVEEPRKFWKAVVRCPQNSRAVVEWHAQGCTLFVSQDCHGCVPQ